MDSNEGTDQILEIKRSICIIEANEDNFKTIKDGVGSWADFLFLMNDSIVFLLQAENLVHLNIYTSEWNSIKYDLETLRKATIPGNAPSLPVRW